MILSRRGLGFSLKLNVLSSDHDGSKTMLLRVAISATLFGLALLPTASLAQQKTAKACQQEWRANKADFQAKGITEKAYVAQCRAGNAPGQSASPAPANPVAAPSGAAGGKSAKACQEEWRANKAAYQAAKVTEKAYVEKCRAGETVALPGAAPAAKPPAPAAAAPANPPVATAAKPRGAVVPPTQAGANQFATESQAKSYCPSDVVVWANLTSKIYHFAGYKNYGHTEHGAYMCEKDANSQGFRASKTERRPGA
jgi:hypothetical protein